MTLAESIYNVQGRVSVVFKDAKNPHHNSKYASLESVLEVLNEPLHENKLILMQFTHWDEANKMWLLSTELSTFDGKEKKIIETPLFGIEDSKNKMQALGSAMTYARRFALMSLFKLAPTDDDGEVLSAPTMAKREAAPPPQPKPIARNFAPTTANLHEFVISVGKKYVGKKLSEVPPEELKKFVNFVETAIHNPQPAHNEFLANAKAYMKLVGEGEDFGI